jgi:hypothetical protein
VIVLPTGAEENHDDGDTDQDHHLTELVGRNESEVILLSLLDLFINAVSDLLALTILHSGQVFFVVLSIEIRFTLRRVSRCVLNYPSTIGYRLISVDI